MAGKKGSLDSISRAFARAVLPAGAPDRGVLTISKWLKSLTLHALAEDIGSGDATSALLIGPRETGKAVLLAKCDGVLAGLPFAEIVFRTAHRGIVFAALKKDGARFKNGDKLAEIRGPLRAILSAERVALNFLQRLSGIATLTRKFVDAVKGTSVKIMDTRKTTPLFRIFEKYAVRMGGGENHRFGLFDAVFIKDNHIAAAEKNAESRSRAIIAMIIAARENSALPVIAEALSVQDALAAADADVVLLDNMPVSRMRRVAGIFRKYKIEALLEASGGVTLENVREIAKTGVRRISVGALTHSAPAADISLELF